MRRCAISIIVLLLALPLIIQFGYADDAQPTEYQLKAAYIYHFAQFVNWPAAAFAQTNSPLVIGVLGDNPFGADLEHTVEGKVLDGHPLKVQEFKSFSDITGTCHILFISSSEKKRFSQISEKLAGKSTLTVGESDRFIEAGGMIQFVLDGGRIRFQINRTAASKAGLTMSFKLLNLASKVQ